MKKNAVTFTDFDKIDLRAGTVVSAKTVSGSKKLLELAVDLGEEYGIVTILTGLSEYYIPEDFTGKKFAFVANLEKKKIFNLLSEGMLLIADAKDKPLLVPIIESVPNGTKLL